MGHFSTRFFQPLIDRLHNIGQVPFCNGISDRAPHFFGYCFILCYRCTFIFIGMAITLLCLKIFKLTAVKNIKLRIKAVIILLLSLPLAFDGFIQMLTAYESTNITRVISGFLFGAGMAYLIDGIFIKKL